MSSATIHTKPLELLEDRILQHRRDEAVANLLGWGVLFFSLSTALVGIITATLDEHRVVGAVIAFMSPFLMSWRGHLAKRYAHHSVYRRMYEALRVTVGDGQPTSRQAKLIADMTILDTREFLDAIQREVKHEDDE